MTEANIVRVSPADVEQTFALFDTDRKGALDAAEVKLTLQALGWGQIPTSVLDDFAAAADSEGLIAIEEFQAVIASKVLESGSQDEVTRMFTFFDFDKNSKVGPKDLARIYKIAHGGEEPDMDYIQEVINWGDLDKDGQLNFQEFSDAVTKYETYIDLRSRRTRE